MIDQLNLNNYLNYFLLKIIDFYLSFLKISIIYHFPFIWLNQIKLCLFLKIIILIFLKNYFHQKIKQYPLLIIKNLLNTY